MDRLTRGFHRIGLVGAVPLALFAAIGFLLPSNGPDQYQFGYIFGFLAALWYGGCRALAWIINGFRPPPSP